MTRAIAGLVVLVVLLLVACSSPPVAAQQHVVAPGGEYTVTVEVQKPAGLRLMERKWEIRAYYFSGGNNYNQGSWWQSGNEWIYSGWYKHRVQPETWSGEPTSKFLTSKPSW